MPVVPSSLDGLLFLFREAFGAPAFETFRMLVVEFICRVGEHSVCGMLQAARLERVWHHSRAHDFFAERKWCPDVAPRTPRAARRSSGRRRCCMDDEGGPLAAALQGEAAKRRKLRRSRAAHRGRRPALGMSLGDT
jgi:hypothetical protein